MEPHDTLGEPTEEVAAPTPWLRVWTLGHFQIEWVDPLSGQITPLPAQRLHGQNAANALGLLKALLSCPDRFATRSWLLEQFWPESRHKSAEERLTDVVSSLRTLLRCEGDSEKRVHFVYGIGGRGAGFRLDGYPALWCDADAFEWSVKHALLLDQRGLDSSACWQRAFTLAERGSYLPEQIYEEWARQRRDHLEGLLRDCLQRWTQLLRQQGYVEEAILRLRSYWLEHLTDEDALRPLLELLGERERFGEAEQYFEKARAALAEDGLEPDPRTRETLEVVRALTVQRRPPGGFPLRLSPLGTAPANSSSVAGSFNSQQFRMLPLLSQVPHPFFPSVTLFKESPLVGNTDEWSIWTGFKGAQLITLIDTWPGSGVCYEQLQAILDRELLMFETILPQQENGATLLSRRQALLTLALLPTTLSALSHHILHQSMVELTLARCAASITALWHLLKGNELSCVEQILSTYLLTLVSLAQQPSPFQKEAAKLTSQAYRLIGIVALHRNNLQAREYYCQQALLFSHVAEEKSLAVSAYISLASTYYYLKKPEKATCLYQQALTYKESISPLQRSRLYAELAVVYAQQRREQDALQAADLAQQCYPQQPEHDPSFLYAEFSLSSFILEEGLTYLALAHHFSDRHYEQEAFRRLSRIETFSGARIVPERILYEVTNQQAEAALLLQERDLFLTYLRKGLQGVKVLKSKQRSQEIKDIYAQAELVWPTENAIKELAPFVTPSA